MDELLNFWKMVKSEFDRDIIEEMAEDAGTDLSQFSQKHLAGLSANDIDTVFKELIALYMDVSGTDSEGDVYELLHNYIEDEERIKKILEIED